MKYRINIDPVTNLSSDGDFFFGTGFFGAEFDTFEELKGLLRKYATFERDGKKYWRKVIKMTFSLEPTFAAVKAEGDRQCKETGMVELFSAITAYRKDPFHKYTIFFRPGKWQDDKGIFSFLLQEDRKDPEPRYGKLKEILKEIGISFE